MTLTTARAAHGKGNEATNVPATGAVAKLAELVDCQHNSEVGMGMLDDFRAVESDTVSRRIALRRFGKAGLLATAGAGMMELIGVGGAKAASPGPAGVQIQSGVPIYTGPTTSTSASPDTECDGKLAVGYCGGPCPPGYWCYKVNYCCFDYEYICLECAGTPNCYYFC